MLALLPVGDNAWCNLLVALYAGLRQASCRPEDCQTRGGYKDLEVSHLNLFLL
jgi:hypothetical protein